MHCVPAATLSQPVTGKSGQASQPKTVLVEVVIVDEDVVVEDTLVVLVVVDETVLVVELVVEDVDDVLV
jgi:hypothetical protein